MLNRALIFAHYDVHNLVDDHVLFSLRSYRQYFSNVIFVTVSKLGQGELRKLHFYADTVLIRTNIGYDFGSWKLGLGELEVREYDEIVIANDSVYWPICDLELFFHRCQESACGLWGCSINKQFQPHLQSYFLVFKRVFIQSSAFIEFWSSVIPKADKMALILEYEIGLSEFARARGFQIDALVRLDEIDEGIRRQCALENNMLQIWDEPDRFEGHPLFEVAPNPMQLYWGQAYRCGIPFLKVEVMRDNPQQNNQKFLIEMLKKNRIYDIELIYKHMRRILSA